MKAIVTFSYGSGSMYSEHVRYFEAETSEKLEENARKYKDLYYPKSTMTTHEIGVLLDEFGSDFISEQNM